MFNAGAFAIRSNTPNSKWNRIVLMIPFGNLTQIPELDSHLNMFLTGFSKLLIGGFSPTYIAIVTKFS